MKNKLLIWIVGGVFFLLSFIVWIKPATERSVAERRELKQMPELSVDSVLSGRFMNGFEEYTLDQFPLRDVFRSFKALTSLKADNNDVYVVDGNINSMDYPLNEASLEYASGRFLNVYDKYLKDNGCDVYLSIIPDKNYFYAEDNSYLSIDYDRLVSAIVSQNQYMEYIDIFPLLTGDSYYKTDTHWKQEHLPEVADTLLANMGSPIDAEYETVLMEEDFFGVYYGQAALPLPADKISYLTNPVISAYEVFDYQNNKAIEVYDHSKMTGNDPYELFIGGPISLVTIENSQSDNDKHLIVFRDSFGSSIAPLLAQGYAKTTLIDIRYMQSAVLGNFVEFTNADVLFLYSTMVLNNSSTLK